jgi:hypothetical protein
MAGVQPCLWLCDLQYANLGILPRIMSNSNGRRDDHQQTQIGFGTQPVGLADGADQHVSGFGRQHCLVGTEKFAFAFDNCQANLTFNIMTVYRQLLAGLEVEIDDLKVGGVVTKSRLNDLSEKSASNKFSFSVPNRTGLRFADGGRIRLADAFAVLANGAGPNGHGGCSLVARGCVVRRGF